ncbi:hypothetical protein HK103_000866 [Boothiomyces macroporosus]|uniref:Uncharacterized protein n=1 Tax=Boothiomyces macroporosus TaxID=261099 RepID=A0AAD5Y3E1_9FUNG|nr:hypothetical protein HK103_000866 [Boothiomyces macroporosus]
MWLLLTTVCAQTGSAIKLIGSAKDDCSYVVQNIQTTFVANCGSSSLLDIANANPVKMCTSQCSSNIQNLDLGNCGSANVQYSGGTTTLANLYAIGLLNTQLYCATDKNNDLCFYATSFTSQGCTECKAAVSSILANSGADKTIIATVQNSANLNCKVTQTTVSAAPMVTVSDTPNITTTTVNLPASYPNSSVFYQRLMGTVFTGMGLACLIFPETTLRLSFTEPTLKSVMNYSIGGLILSPAAKLLMQAFGSQATLCGVLILNAKFTQQTFFVFGVSMIPFFVFDYMAYAAGFLSPLGAIGDAIGNTIFSYCCYKGYTILNLYK